MPFLPVDTAVVVEIGPCIDDTDFKTLETAIAYNASGMSVDLIKNSGTAVAKVDITPTTGSTNDWTHKGNGVYELELTAAQNDAEGTLRIVGVCDGVLPFESPVYSVVPTKVYNSLVAGSDNLEVDAVAVSGDSTAADNLESDYDGTGYAKTNSTVATVTTVTNTPGSISGTVDTATNSHTPTKSEFQADDITEATENHYRGRRVRFTGGNLNDQSAVIIRYEAVGGIGQFTVTPLTEAPANNDTFVIEL